MKPIKKRSKVIALILSCALLYTSCKKFDYGNITEKNMSSSFNNVSLKSSQILSYSGKDMFKGIFFGLGEFCNNIELLETNANFVNSLSPELKNEYSEAINIFIDSLSEINQSFFSDFESKIKGGEHNQIERAIIGGSQLIVDNLDLLFPNLNSKVGQIQDHNLMKNLSLNNIDELNNYISEIQSDEFLENLLDENLVSSGVAQNQKACLAWAVAVVVYFAVAAHNTVAVVVLVVAKAAFWWGINDLGNEYNDIASLHENDLLKAELLVNQIANYANH